MNCFRLTTPTPRFVLASSQLPIFRVTLLFAVVVSVLAPFASAQEGSSGKRGAPPDYLNSAGQLRERLYVECQAMGGAREGNVNAAVGAKMVLNIGPDGTWTYLGDLGVGVADVGFVAVKGRKNGRLSTDELKTVSEILQDNDFAKLSNYSNATRAERGNESSVFKVKVTIKSGKRTCVCFLRDLQIAGQSQPISRTSDAGGTASQSISARYEDIYQRLFALIGVNADQGSLNP